MRKAQVQQVFIYIMALLVIGLLVLFGYRMISGLLDKSCQVKDSNLVSAMTTAIDGATRYGSVKNAQFQAPCEFTLLCFVDHEQLGVNEFTVDVPDELQQAYPAPFSTIESSVREAASYNIFLIEEKRAGSVRPVAYDGRITTRDARVVCFQAKDGVFSVWMAGEGQGMVAVYDQ